MYSKRLILTMLVLLSLFAMSALPALGQDAPWFVYLYNGSVLVRVNQDGTQETFDIGVGADVFVGAREMAFSPDGSRVAFCANYYPPAVEGQASAPPATRVYLRDVAAQTNLLDLDLGSAIACRVGETGLSPDGALLTIGRINYMPGDPAADISKPAWQLLVVDTATGNVAYELNAQSPAVASLGAPAEGIIMPFVQNVDTSSVVFALVPWFTEGFIAAAYRWDLASGAIAPETAEQWMQFRADRLEATGETAWPAVDSNLPVSEPMGVGFAFNVVRVADSAGQVTTIYHNADRNPADARFINNGQQVAILLAPVFDENNPGAPVEQHWVAVDRAGSVTDLVTDLSLSYLEGAPGGFIHLIQDSPDQDPNNATYRLLYVANGQTTELWSLAASNDQFGAWELAWVALMPVADGLPPFTPIAS